MKRVCVALVVVVLLGGCTGNQTPAAQPSAQAAVQEARLPSGYYRQPKDGELCKKLDPAPLQALVPGIEFGPATGVFRNQLKCDFMVNTPSLVTAAVSATFFDSPEQLAKSREEIFNAAGEPWRPITLPVSKAEAFASGVGVMVFDQNMMLSGGAYATDKAVLTQKLADVLLRMVDDMLPMLRKQLQSTGGPSPTAQAREIRVVSPNAVRGRAYTYSEQQYDEIRFVLREDLDRLDPSPAVASVYGNTKANNVLIFAATIAVFKAEAQIDGTLARLAREGITMSKPDAEKVDEFTEMRCGEGKIKSFTGALCLWRDKDSIGVAAFPGQKPADVKADFIALRDLVTKG